MPRYDYECAVCGRFEQRSSMAKRDSQTCPTCGAFVMRVFSATENVVVPARWGYDKAGYRDVRGD